MHPKFSAKTASATIREARMKDGALGVYDWKNIFHGTHVAAIAAGSRNGQVMHGVAFDVDILGASFMDDLESDLVKNSNELKKVLIDVEKAFNAKQLTIFSAGNGGHSSPSLRAQTNWFNDKAEFYLLGVSNIYNKFGNAGGLVRNSNGKISGDWLLNCTSDATKYLEDASVGAPGSEILSAYSDFAQSGNGYIRASGTSMATPYVTGAAALIQQAFPYMDGKQIADVILSTANKDIALKENFRVAFRTDSEIDADGNKNETIFIGVYYFDDKNLTEDEVVADLNHYVDTMNFSAAPEINTTSKKNLKEIIQAAKENSGIKVYFQTPLQALIGQGIVDAGKAVDGLAALNARRLDASDVSTNFGDKIALYTIDTKGFDSTWRNDICEIREGKLASEGTEPDLIERYNYYFVNWLSKDLSDYNLAYWSDILTEKYVKAFNDDVDKDGLEGLHVGLKKIGDGRLNLAGNNTYAGASVVEQGTLSIDGSVAGDAYSLNAGTIAGRGVIHGTLYNRGAAQAGDASQNGNLTADNLTSSGKLIVNISGANNTKFIVNGTANLDGTIFVAEGENISGKEIVALTAKKITGKIKTASPNYRAEIRGNSVVLLFK